MFQTMHSLRWIEVRVHESLADLAQVQVFETQRKSSYTILNLYFWSF